MDFDRPEPPSPQAASPAQVPLPLPELTILDHLEAAVYVADMQTHEILYANRYLRERFGQVVGRPCYRALHSGQEGPCTFCNNDVLVDEQGRPAEPVHWEFRNTRNGRWYYIVDRAIPWKDGRPVRLEIALDITERKRREEVIAHQAAHDALTGLLNRRELQQALWRVHANAERHGQSYTVMLFDLDRFKLINDCYGHDQGDEVLRWVAAAAAKTVRRGDWLGRWGGEEFLCILPETTYPEAYEIAERLRAGIEALEISCNDRVLHVSTSVGLAVYPQDGDAPDALLCTADSALYEAKRAGRNRIQGGNMSRASIFSIASSLEEALRENRIQPAFQPIVELASGNRVAEEALARLVLGPGQAVDAGRFIEAASNLQIAHRIDSLIIERTIRRCARQMEETGQSIKHFVNTSADLFRHPDLIQSILDVAKSACASCQEDGADGKPLVIEITEREFIGDTRHVRRVLAPLIDFGLTVAIDDFGSGYSSFQYLADLPVSFLKIEGSLVRRIKHEAHVRAIVRGIRDIARDLGVLTVAEQIEDAQTRDILREIGIDWGQGYYFGRPELAAEAEWEKSEG